MSMSWRTLILLATLLSPLASLAHEVRPAYLELREGESGEFSVLWKTPMRGDLRLALAPEFSGKSENVTPVATRETGGAAVQTWRIKPAEPLRGQTLRILGLDGTMTDALARIEFADGSTWLHRLTPQEPAAVIPDKQSGWSVAGEYLKLGVEHILLGIDHLLFVLALLLITQGAWRLAKTVTAFTVAHSITLALATLGFVHVPQAPVEAIIALSIVFVATEIVRLKIPSPLAGESVGEGATSLTARAPWIVAFTFGLLHGFGFAGALTEIGLPEGHIPLALLFFNVGVEVGQLLFIAVVLAFLWMVRDGLNKLRDTGYVIRVKNPESQIPHPASRIPHLESRINYFTAYAIGSVAMFWVIQRIAAF